MQNAFDRLGNQGTVLGNIEENTRSSSEAVAVGGDLYEKVNELTTAITDMKDGKVSGGMGVKNALALAIVSPAMEGIGKGFGFIVEAINNLEGTGDEIKAKTEALVGGLVLLGDVGASILKFAGYMVLATPLLIIAAIGAPFIAITLFALTMAVNLATRNLDEKQLEKVQMLGDVGKSILFLVGSLALASVLMPFALKAIIPTLVIVGAFVLITALLPEKKVQELKTFGEGLLQVALD